MPHPLSCPDRDLLDRLLRGELSDCEAEPLEEHLSGCESCARTAAGQTAVGSLADTLRAAARAGGETVTPPVRQLMARLRDWPAEPPPVRAAGRYPFLAAAAAPGEMGWLGPYRVLEVVGSGGMGVVFRAQDSRVKRVVALKVLLDVRCADPRYRARFQGEAEAVARLRHPNIVPLFEVGEHEGRPYLVLEYVETSLAERLAGRPQPSRAAADLVLALARAVHHAHQQGVLHRDLKPANVLLAADRTPKVGDFGLAKRLDEDGLTQTGDLLGTPGYMAPELTRGHGPGGEGGPAADVYGLGAILYELLTGRPPFGGATVIDTLEQVRSLDPVPPSRLQPAVPRDLNTICLACLRKEPGKRYASALALADDLVRFLDGRPIRARRVGAAERLAKWARRRPALAALLVVTGVALVVTAAGAGRYERRLRQALDDTAAERSRADANYREARAALQRMLDRTRARHRAEVPNVRELWREQQEDAARLPAGHCPHCPPLGPIPIVEVDEDRNLLSGAYPPTCACCGGPRRDDIRFIEVRVAAPPAVEAIQP